jgi:hypothetical protein
MSERAERLLATADGQIAELIALLSAGGEAMLGLPCPGREKMGDGTVAACALHTADHYQQIAEFLRGADKAPGRESARKGPHRIPRFLLAGRHRTASHAERGHDHGGHGGGYSAEHVGLDGLLDRVAAARVALGVLAELTDEQLDTVPGADSFRFCDGQRTLEQVIAGLLKHQGHQVDAIRAARA